LASHTSLMKLFGSLDKVKKHESLLMINEQLKLENKVVLRNMDVFLALKKELNAIFLDTKLISKKEKKVRNILNETIKQLKLLRIEG